MSIQCLRRIIEQSKARGHSRLLLMVIAERADDAGFAYPGLDYLQHGTAMCHQAVVNNITALESRGELFVDRRRGGSNNRYLVLAGLSDYQISELLTGDKFQMSIEAAHAALESIRVAESIEQTQRQGNKSFGHTRAESGDQSRTESVEQTQIPESTGLPRGPDFL